MTAPQRPFTLNLYFPDGNADGYRIISHANWTGKCVICPKSLFTDKKKESDFNKPGVYILVGASDESSKEKVYIGEADPILDRMNRHYGDNDKDWWTKVIFFTSDNDSLTKGHIQYLEKRLISLARDAGQCDLANTNTPTLPSLPQAVVATTEVFLDEILCCLSAIGIRLFIKSSHTSRKLLFIKAKGIVARGYETEDGFVVCKGSQAVLKETPSFETYNGGVGVRRVRKLLITDGILKPENDGYVFSQDYLFVSSGAAANIIQATPVSGLETWKNEQGISLKEIRTQKSAT